jgi:hypothetical protein
MRCLVFRETLWAAGLCTENRFWFSAGRLVDFYAILSPVAGASFPL